MNLCAALLCIFAVTFSGCAAVGVAATSDPIRKLQDAEVLFMSKNRPLPAEALIREAIPIFQQRKDWQWLGHAYREYGDLLKSASVARLEPIYRRYGFRDRSITFDNRLEKAADFYRLALGSYKNAESANLQASQYDALTNLYLNMGLSSHELGENLAACEYYSKMVESADKNRQLHPSVAPAKEIVRRMAMTVRAASGCGETT